MPLIGLVLLRENMQLLLGDNSVTAIMEFSGLHAQEAKPLVGAFRTDTLAFQIFMNLLSYRLRGELVDRCQWEALTSTANTNGLMVRSNVGLFVRLSSRLIVRC